MQRLRDNQQAGTKSPVMLFRLACILALLAGVACAPTHLAPGQDWARGDIVAGAGREGALSIYANTGVEEVGPLLQAFNKLYPKIKITFLRLNSAPLYDRFVSDTAARKPTADLVWSSAMDLQIKLINDGYAQSYSSTQKSALPAWAVWKDQGYGITAEPVVFVYDKRRLSPALVPRTHTELRRLLEAKAMPGAVATYDPNYSAIGFLYYSQDRVAWADTLALDHAIGETHPTLYTSTGSLLSDVNSGGAVFGYNVIGSYALERQSVDPYFGVVFPSDYTLVMSRIAFISARAAHPNAAKLYLDFMLSREGQELLAKSRLRPVRTDLHGGGVPGPNPDAARPIEVGPALLANLDQMRRARLLRDWQEALGPNHRNNFVEYGNATGR